MTTTIRAAEPGSRPRSARSGSNGARGRLGPPGASTSTIVDDQWHHLVGVKTITQIALYVDGELAAQSDVTHGTFSNFTKELLSGNFPIGTAPVYTYASELEVDELAVFRRALTASEVDALYARGVLHLRLQVRGCDPGGCDAQAFVGPDGTSASFFSDEASTDPGLPLAQPLPAVVAGAFFEYLAILESDAPDMSPQLDGVQLLVGFP